MVLVCPGCEGSNRARGIRSSTPVSFALVDPETPTPPIGPAGSPGAGRPSTTGPILYKGDELNAERGPGLGCFRFQLILLVILIIATPLSVELGAAPEVSAILLFVTLGVLLVAGQTIIFLLRLVAAERRGRRRPLASGSMTVGEIEDSGVAATRRTAADVAATTEDTDAAAALEPPAADDATGQRRTDA